MSNGFKAFFLTAGCLMIGTFIAATIFSVSYKQQYPLASVVEISNISIKGNKATLETKKGDNVVLQRGYIKWPVYVEYSPQGNSVSIKHIFSLESENTFCFPDHEKKLTFKDFIMATGYPAGKCFGGGSDCFVYALF
jgi:hypothetical protein